MEEVEAEHQKRFEAAVRVVKSLPNDGSYKPSHELMLKFYGFYKQATQGPCKMARPGFWDPVGRYKWDAWNSLGEMTKDEAMVAYVNEMKKILESIPITDKVEELLHLLGPFYEVMSDMPRPPGFATHQAAEKLDRMEKTLEELSGALTSTPNHNGQAYFQDSEDEDEDDSIDDNGEGKNQLLQVKRTDIDQHEEREVNALHAESSDGHSLENPSINVETCKKSERNNGLDSGRESDLGSSPAESMNGSESELEQNTQIEHRDEGPDLSMENEEEHTPQESDFNQKYITIDKSLDCEARVQHFISDSDSEVFCDSVEQILLEEAWESAGGNNGLLNHSDALDQRSLFNGNCLSADLALITPVGHGGEGLGPGQGKPGSDKTVLNEGEKRGMKPERGGRRGTPREGARGHHSGGSGAGGGGDGEDVRDRGRHHSDVSEQIAATLVRLQQDMQSILQRLSTLETLAATQARSVAFSPQHYEMHIPARSNHSRWPFEMSTTTIIFFMVWPFVAQWLVHVLRRRRKFKKGVAGALLSSVP